VQLRSSQFRQLGQVLFLPCLHPKKKKEQRSSRQRKIVERDRAANNVNREKGGGAEKRVATLTDDSILPAGWWAHGFKDYFVVRTSYALHSFAFSRILPGWTRISLSDGDSAWKVRSLLRHFCI
jgi:hypothetical protein